MMYSQRSVRIARHGFIALMAVGALGACTPGDSVVESTSEPSPTETGEAAAEASPESAPTSEVESPSPTPEEPPAPEEHTVDTVAMLEDLWETTSDRVAVCELWRQGDYRTMLRDYEDGWDFQVVDQHFADRCSEPDGSRHNPYPVDAILTGGDWQVSVADVNLDAADIVSAQNQFNDPPSSGQQYVMINVHVAYHGQDEPVDPWWLLDFAIVGSEGNTFTDSCGVIPEPLRDVGDMYSGASASGNVCLSAATNQLDGATLRISLGRGTPAFLLLSSE